MSEKDVDPKKVKESLDEVVEQLDQGPESSKSWGTAMSANREEWERLKKEISTRQKALKELVKEKKAGLIGPEEFEQQYRELQDELTALEFRVYNLRLGKKIEM